MIFNIFINDTEVNIIGNMSIFAKNTKLSRAIVTLQDSGGLQKDLDKIVGWAETWQIRVNTEKCKVMHMEARNVKANYTLYGIRGC